MRQAVCVVTAVVAAAACAACGGSRTAKPVAGCSPVVYDGPGKPKYLIVSDLPLRAPPGAALQTKGIEYILRRRHFRAGTYRIGYQSCDESSAATGGRDMARCLSNAKAIAADPAVLGVVGPYNSECAALEIPVANAAPDGPLAMIGTGTTNPQLTSVAPGNDLGTPRKYYPTGLRNFVRLTAPDQYQAAAAAIMFRNANARRVFVLRDGEAYGDELASWFTTDLRRLGLRTTGSSTWNPRAKSYDDLARRVARAAPDGVYFAGYSFLHGALVLKAVREAIGKKPLFIGPDGFADVAGITRDAGRAADGLLVTWAGVPTRDAGAAGQRLLRKTGREPLGQYGALYGAAAASLLLDAVARSDGSRKNVVTKLFAGATPSGFLGRMRFDADGDPSVGAMTVFRIAHGRLSLGKTVYPTGRLAKGRSLSP